MSKPTRSILDRRFKYTNAANTDVTRTWRRARLLQRIQQGQQQTSVVSITARKVVRG